MRRGVVDFVQVEWGEWRGAALPAKRAARKGRRLSPPPAVFGEAEYGAPRRCANSAVRVNSGVYKSVRGQGKLKAAIVRKGRANQKRPPREGTHARQKTPPCHSPRPLVGGRCGFQFPVKSPHLAKRRGWYDSADLTWRDTASQHRASL